ncbi:psbP domain-containing protein 3, chloroplastic [Zea mays]|uniref:psbP domain-containing protein 3, chloroplastic n=1 Tax=Zea mays TaxID=4577 RepID=UPI0004DE7E54|nr:psbP domain-containing protein 3, chloroplastic [Zea mays]|eukprot:XP_008671805.1 psbP domain-containing protein 3, chloroplastic [Zea mays]
MRPSQGEPFLPQSSPVWERSWQMGPASAEAGSSPAPFQPSPSRSSSQTTYQHRPVEEGLLGRRDALLLGIVFSAMTPALLAPAGALADEATAGSGNGDMLYKKLCARVSTGWLVGVGEASGINSVTAFYPEQAAADSNVSVAITGIGPDFTSLKSFGDVDAFAEGLIRALGRSWQRPPGLAAKLIHSRAANSLYYLEYTLQNPGERRRHIVSAIGMAFNGWYNRLHCDGPATFEYNGRTFPYAFGDVLNGRTPGKQFVKKFQGSPYLFVKMDQCKATIYGSDLTNY